MLGLIKSRNVQFCEIARHPDDGVKLGSNETCIPVFLREATPDYTALALLLVSLLPGLVKTIFILRYLLHQPPRRKTTTQLGKDEQLHALRRWHWVGATGCFATNEGRAQQTVVGCLNLLTTAVVV